MELLMLALYVSSLTVLSQASPPQQSGIAEGEALATPVPGTEAPGLLENGDDEGEEEHVGEPDFEDDDDEDDSFPNLVDSKDGNVDSLMHVHHKGGEILVPCFGMWWPVGGGPPVYEYVDEYYDGDRKRRRSRKRKRAKAKRKKS